MLTTQELIERLQAEQKAAGKALYVTVQRGEELIDLRREIILAADHEQTGEMVIVLKLDE
jgi:hypothetical protein